MKLLIIDGMNVVLHQYYGLQRQNLRTSTGEPTWGLYGFITVLSRYVRNLSPDFVVVTFDNGGSDFRKALFPGYKSGRKKDANDNLRSQFELVHRFLSLAGIPQVSVQGVEADDLIAGLCLDFQEKFSSPKVAIVSADHDMLQLVNESVVCIKPSSGKNPEVVFDLKSVEELFSLPPHRLPELWAITGDPSDAIPGVPGLGPKKALKALQQFESFQEMVQSPEYEQYSSLLTLNYTLIKLSADLATESLTALEEPFGFEVQSCQGLMGPPSGELVRFMKLYELKTQLSKMEEGTLWRK